jgi:hypothetical protein
VGTWADEKRPDEKRRVFFLVFFLKFAGWFCQGHPDARWASTWVRSRLKGIAAAPRSSIVIYVIMRGWSHSGEEGWEAAPWSVDFGVDLLKRMDMACA